jgi:hypothetical protein
MGGYSFEYYTYRYKNHPGWDKVLTASEICAMGTAKNFNRVVVFHLQQERFYRINCNEYADAKEEEMAGGSPQNETSIPIKQ